METAMNNRPKIGISACLTGLRVRYDGAAKLQEHIVNFFADKAELIPVCPETGCGLGVPRETIHLVGDPALPRLETTATRRDITAQMQAGIEPTLTELAVLHDIKGFIFKARSPSCGYKDTPVWQADGSSVIGQGLFAQAVSLNLPQLVCADEEQLKTLTQLEAFWRQIFSMT